jgi:hypothetical protein
VALALVLVVCLHAGWAQGRVVEDNFNQHQTPLEFMAKFCYSDAGLPPSFAIRPRFSDLITFAFC